MKNIFIIVNYNDFENTNKLINNIKDFKVLDEIIVVDNCSNDDSYKQLNKLKIKKLKILKTEKNKGYGSAINFAAKYCETKYNDCNLIISNSDIEIKQEDDLIELVDIITKNTTIGIIAPLINQHGK